MSALQEVVLWLSLSLAVGAHVALIMALPLLSLLKRQRAAVARELREIAASGLVSHEPAIRLALTRCWKALEGSEINIDPG